MRPKKILDISSRKSNDCEASKRNLNGSTTVLAIKERLQK